MLFHKRQERLVWSYILEKKKKKEKQFLARGRGGLRD